jgi:hypothetical protein
MREKTRSELVTLANKLVEEFDLNKIIGSNEFLEAALDLAEENDIEVGRPTLIRYESELKRICKGIEGEKFIEDKFTEDKFDQFLEQYVEERKLIMTINYYDDGTYEKVKPQSFKEDVVLGKVPEYSMFAEGEDGLIVLKGTYKGKTLDEINVTAGFDTAKRGWAKYMLQQDKNLTEDDREVFNKIILGLL